MIISVKVQHLPYMDRRWKTQLGTTCFQRVPGRQRINMSHETKPNGNTDAGPKQGWIKVPRGQT